MLVKNEGAFLSRNRTLPMAEMVTAFYQLSRLLGAGVVMSDALEEVARASGTRDGRNQWARVARKVSSGNDLSESLRAVFPNIDNTIVALIRAGEASGKLEHACQAVSDHLKWQYELRQRLVTLLIYPLFSVCLLLLVTGFLFVSVVPSVKGFLVSAGGELEWHTQLLIDTSSLFSQFYLHGLISVAISVAVVSTLMYVSLSMRTWADNMILVVPVIGTLVKELSLSRYAHCCSQLYSSGVSLERSLELAEAVVGNLIINSELCTVRRKMVGGTSLTESMRKMSTLPAIVSRMIYIGENSGQVAQVLSMLAVQLSTSADASIKRIEQLIAPVIMMFVGFVLLWIVVSVMGPVYNMAISTVLEAG